MGVYKALANAAVTVASAITAQSSSEARGHVENHRRSNENSYRAAESASAAENLRSHSETSSSK
jgi:uncharacterized membrane protein YccC